MITIIKILYLGTVYTNNMFDEPPIQVLASTFVRILGTATIANTAVVIISFNSKLENISIEIWSKQITLYYCDQLFYIRL